MKYYANLDTTSVYRSLRSPERGLKFISANSRKRGVKVAPFAGAWIEILSHGLKIIRYLVAPFAGAWIEILFI